MIAVAVELDGDPLLAPQGVDLPVADVDVGFGQWPPLVFADLEEQALEVALCVCELRSVALEGKAKALAPRAAFADRGLDLVDVQNAPVLGFGQRAADEAERRSGRKVNDCLGKGGDRKAVVPGPFAPSPPMHPNPADRAALAGRADADRSRPVL